MPIEPQISTAKANAQLLALEKRVKSLTQSLNNQKEKYSELESKYGSLSKAVSKYTASQVKAAASTKTLSAAATAHGSALRGVAGAAGLLWAAYGQLLPMMTAFAAATVAKEAVKQATAFEYTTKMVIALTDSTDEANNHLEEMRGQLSSFWDLRQGPNELALGMKEFAKAGVGVSRSLSDISEMSKFASLAETDLATATKLVIGQTNVFGGTFSDTANKIAAAALSSATDITGMAQALSYTTELGSIAKFSMDDVAAALAVLANRGISSSKAGTALRTTFIKLLNPTEKTKEVLKQMNVEFSAMNADGSIKSLEQQLKDLSVATAHLTEEELVRLVDSLSGFRGMRALGNLIRDTGGEFDAMKEKVQGATDSLTFIQKVYGEMADTAKAKSEVIAAIFERDLKSIISSDVVKGILDSLINARKGWTLLYAKMSGDALAFAEAQANVNGEVLSFADKNDILVDSITRQREELNTLIGKQEALKNAGAAAYAAQLQPKIDALTKSYLDLQKQLSALRLEEEKLTKQDKSSGVYDSLEALHNKREAVIDKLAYESRVSTEKKTTKKILEIQATGYTQELKAAKEANRKRLAAESKEAAARLKLEADTTAKIISYNNLYEDSWARKAALSKEYAEAHASDIEAQKDLEQELLETEKETTSSALEYQLWALDQDIKKKVEVANGDKALLNKIEAYHKLKYKEILRSANTLSGGILDALYTVSEEWTSMADVGREAILGIRDTAASELGDFFIDTFGGIEGAWGDLWDSMLQTFAKALVDMAAAWAASEVIQWLTGNESGGFSFSFGGSSSGSSVGGVAGSIATSAVKSYVTDNVIVPAAEAVVSYFTGSGAAGAIGAAAASSSSISAGTASSAILDAYATYGGASAAGAAAGGTAAGGTAAGGTAAGGGSAAAGGGAAAGGAAAAGAAMIPIAMFALSQYFSRTTADRMNNRGITGQDISATGVSSSLTSLNTFTGANEVNESLSQLYERLGEFSQVSYDAQEGVMVMTTAIRGDGGLIESVDYSMQTFDAASGKWTTQTGLFKQMEAEMERLSPTTSEAIQSTAEYVSAMYGVPSVADELAASFSQVGVGLYYLEDAATAAGANIAGAASYINSAAGQASDILSQLSDRQLFYMSEDDKQDYVSGIIAQSGEVYQGARALGGYIPAGGYATVGERGPELVSGPATVTSTRETAKIQSSGTTVPINVNVGNETLTKFVVKIVDGVVSVREQQNVPSGRRTRI